MAEPNSGFQEALRYPLFSAIFQRRSRRIARGLASVPAGSLSYTSSQPPQPLTPLEEAMLIASTGITGIPMHDMPFENNDGRPVPVAAPMLEMAGRAAGSPDNAQATHFFLINDQGTYFLKRPEGLDPHTLAGEALTPETFIQYAEKCKVQVLDHRLDFPRVFPCYIGANGYISNLPGTTILMPIVDMTRQYINGLMYVLAQEEGQRPVFLDDWNFYRPAGVKKWIKRGFLNKKLPLPLGQLGTLRTDYEAHLLLQNISLVIQAMGLGGWYHAGFYGPLLLGDADYRQYGPGLSFRYHTPQRSLWRKLCKPITPLPAWRPNPVGLDGVIQGYCPPYFSSMSEAVDALLKEKYGEGGVYHDPRPFNEVFKEGLGARFLDEVPHYPPEVVECAKDICNYIYNTYGRFPAHVDAMYVPGVWVQAHHLDLEYYDHLFRHGYTQTQAQHQRLWHSEG
jgi:hypothetical protein